MSVEPFAPAASEGARPLRWAIIALIFAGTLVNYIDRQAISVLAPVLCRDLGLSNTEYGSIGSVFLFTYAFSMWLWGAVFDWLGSRRGYSPFSSGRWRKSGMPSRAGWPA